MKSGQHNYTNTGIVALVVLAAAFGIMPVLARYLGQGLGLFEQWYLRFAVAFVVAVIVFWPKLNFKKFFALPGREWILLIFRVLAGQVIALGLFTLAAQKAEVGVVSLMQVVPILPLLGILLFRERLDWRKALITVLAFVGAAMVAVPSLSSASNLNIGALFSLLAGIFYSLMLATRKWHSNRLNNQELTVVFLGLSCLLTYLCSLVMEHRWIVPAEAWNWQFVLVVAAAGVLSTAVNFLISYGFEHVSTIIAGNILSLEEVFGVLFGYLFYQEVLNARELFGGLVILVSVLLMNFAIRREHKIAEQPIGATN